MNLATTVGQDVQLQDTSMVLRPPFIVSSAQVQSENMLYRMTLPRTARALHAHSESFSSFTQPQIAF